MSSGGTRVYIQVESEAEQEEHLKQQRKTLKPLNGNDKENLTGPGLGRASTVDQLSRLKAAGVNQTPSIKYGKRKCVDATTAAATTTIQTQDANTQTDEIAVNAADKPITAEDLTSASEPGENYYKQLAEQRREALEQTLNENRHLYERIEGLEEEKEIMLAELDTTKQLVEVLKEICGDNEQDEEQQQQQQPELESESDPESEPEQQLVSESDPESDSE